MANQAAATTQTTQDKFWALLGWSGPYAPLIAIYLLCLPLLLLSRALLVIWQIEQFDTQTMITTLAQGLRVDLILVGLVVLIPLLLLPVMLLFRRRRGWQQFSHLWLVAAVLLILLLELITPVFILEYGSRPNSLLIEYLQYPKEVFSMLFKGFQLALAIVLSSLLIAAWLLAKFAKPWKCQSQYTLRPMLFWLTYPIILILVLVSIRSSFGHRPANPAMFAITNNPIINTLILNSSYSTLYAAYNLKYEKNSSQVYGKLSDDEIIAGYQRLQHQFNPKTPLLKDAKHPTLSHHIASQQRTKPLNIVIILEESLGAGFVQSLGGKPLTPELDALRSEGWWFEHLYATGTRSVRGIEAVVAGFPPTPARSVVKRSKAQQHFTTLASILANKGYHTSFIYGGEAHFDNMRGFFLGNGFQQIIEQKDFTNPKFVGSWGVSDEDLLNRTHQELMQQHASGQPFFKLVFTSSNHAPFDFPDGRIKFTDTPNKNTENHAVHYASYALGAFFKQAKASPYYQDTLFLVVADHDIRVRGDHLIPVEHFHIPGLILGAGITPKQIHTVASQIDLAPTLLSLAGVDSDNPMIGRDLSKEKPDNPGRAMMQYNDHFGWMEGNQLTILRPDKSPTFATYNDEMHTLRVSEAPDDAKQQTSRAVLSALLPEWLYQHRSY